MKSNGARILQGIGLASVVILGVTLATGCALRRGRGVETSGFLGDYSQLKPGDSDQALLRYVSPTADFSKYKKILLDPIKVYPGMKDSYLRSISPADLQKLLNYFDAALRTQLGERFTFVTEPGPDVMRIRVALTEAHSALVPLDIVSTVVPIGLGISTVKTILTGEPTAVGEASAEFEAQDSLTGERLAAAVDKRVGTKLTGQLDKLEKWRTAKDASDYWAESLSTRLAEIQAGKR